MTTNVLFLPKSQDLVFLCGQLELAIGFANCLSLRIEETRKIRC